MPPMRIIIANLLALSLLGLSLFWLPPDLVWQLFLPFGGGVGLGIWIGWVWVRPRSFVPVASKNVGSPQSWEVETERGVRRSPLRSSPVYQLVIATGKEWASHNLIERQCVIGSSPGCDIRLDHPQVADLHVRVSRVGHAMSLVDLGSPQGTTLGAAGLRLSPHQPSALQVGDEFWLAGAVRCRLQLAD